MVVEIYSKKAIVEKIEKEDIRDAAVISFYTPRHNGRGGERVDYFGACKRVFYVSIPDIDIDVLGDYGYTYDTYFSENEELARFIYNAVKEKRRIICQCDYGQSRSAACAAAILQHFCGRGIDIFADYRYYPNQLVYHKVMEGLLKIRDEVDNAENK